MPDTKPIPDGDSIKGKYGVLTSSADPHKLSLTVRGLLVALVPFGLAFVPGTSEAELNGLVDGIVALVQASTALFAAAVTVWGIARKIYKRIR